MGGTHMETKKIFFRECHLAGRQYYSVNEIWSKLSIGTKLIMERDYENRYDPAAVLVKYVDEESGEAYKLGYIPKSDNDGISQLLEMGWGSAFECLISRLSPTETYEQQIHLTISVLRKE